MPSYQKQCAHIIIWIIDWTGLPLGRFLSQLMTGQFIFSCIGFYFTLPQRFIHVFSMYIFFTAEPPNSFCLIQSNIWLRTFRHLFFKCIFWQCVIGDNQENSLCCRLFFLNCFVSYNLIMKIELNHLFMRLSTLLALIRKLKCKGNETL